MNKVKNLVNRRAFKNSEETVTFIIILFFRYIYYKNIEIGRILTDSHSYLTWNLESFYLGIRMPIYPLLIALNRILFHAKYLVGVVCCQIIISLVAVVLIWKAINIATDNKRISCIVTIIWGCNPGIFCYDAVILTESLAISVSVIMLYFIVSYLKYNTLKDGCGGGNMCIPGHLDKTGFIYIYSINNSITVATMLD